MAWGRRFAPVWRKRVWILPSANTKETTGQLLQNGKLRNWAGRPLPSKSTKLVRHRFMKQSKGLYPNSADWTFWSTMREWRWGGHDVPLGDLEAFTPEIWDEMMAVNVRGPYLVARAAYSHLRTSKWGRIVNIGSTIGHGDWYADRPFYPSKAAVVPLTRFLAASLAPDVTVNCVSPGLMAETPMGSGGPQSFYEVWKNRSALGVTTSIADVAGQVAFFCETSSITGQSVVVDGGINFH